MTSQPQEKPIQNTIETQSVREFFCVGSNHRTADISAREEFVLTTEQIEQCLAKVSQKFNLAELTIISTCNRCEVFGVTKHGTIASPELMREIYSFIHSLHNQNTPVDIHRFKHLLYTLSGIDAVRHTFLVASSLDSLVPGETQITGQFKDAIAVARTSGTLGPMLGRLSQEALATAKKVRSNTDIGKHRVSISHAAIDLAKRASSDLTQVRFLILGAGEMARVAAEYAANYKPQALVIANRTKQKAFALTQHLGFGDAHGLENLHQLIQRSDVVISATSSQNFILVKDDIVKVMKSRQDGPLFLIDIALPRDIDPTIADIDNVYLFDIDDLKSVVDAHMEKRQEGVRAAQSIVAESVSHFEKWLAHHEVAPTIAGASDYFASIMRKESLKTLSRDQFSNLSPKQRESLNSMLEAIASRITGDIAQALRKSDPQDAKTIADTIDLIFQKDSTHE